MTKGLPIKGVLFDMDGTLTVPVLDFAGMRNAVGIPRPLDVLEEIEKMDEEAKQRAFRIIEEFEEEGKRRFELQPGVHELMEFLDHHKIPKAIVTRNSQAAIEFMKSKVNFNFSMEISREFKPFKPNPHPSLHVCKAWNVDPQHCLFVGDSKDDMLCGRQAGNITVLLKQDNNKDPNIHSWTDFTVSHLVEVKRLIAEGFEVHK